MIASFQSGVSSTISVVRPEEFSTETARTLESVRMSAISAIHGIISSLWAGMFVVEPLGKTGIHHHGDQDTVVYLLEGEALVRWGQSGEYSAIVKTGDLLHVPCWLPHQELNPSSQKSFRWVVVRSSPDRLL